VISFTYEKAKFDIRSIYLTRKPVGILARHNSQVTVSGRS
jgi:hypothetical protein